MAAERAETYRAGFEAAKAAAVAECRRLEAGLRRYPTNPLCVSAAESVRALSSGIAAMEPAA